MCQILGRQEREKIKSNKIVPTLQEFTVYLKDQHIHKFIKIECGKGNDIYMRPIHRTHPVTHRHDSAKEAHGVGGGVSNSKDVHA